MVVLQARVQQALVGQVHELLDTNTTQTTVAAGQLLWAIASWLLAPTDKDQAIIQLRTLSQKHVPSLIPLLDEHLTAPLSSTTASASASENATQLAVLRARLAASPLLVRQVQALLLGSKASNLAPALGSKRWNRLLKRWFCPVLRSKRSDESQSAPQDAAAADMTLWGIRVLCQAADLRSVEDKSNEVLTGSILYLGMLYARLPLGSFYQHLELQQPPDPVSGKASKRATMHRIEWPDAVHLLVSLPARLANVSRGHLPPGLEPK